MIRTAAMTTDKRLEPCIIYRVNGRFVMVEIVYPGIEQTIFNTDTFPSEHDDYNRYYRCEQRDWP